MCVYIRYITFYAVHVNLADIDECVEMRGVCENGRCENTVGSYRCDCDNGFQVERDRCVGTAFILTAPYCMHTTCLHHSVLI